jgi:hypothetical protein
VSVSIEYEQDLEEGKAERVRIDAPESSALPREVELSATESQPMHLEHLASTGGLVGCLRCGHLELFRQKDFPRAAGMAVVVLAAVLAPFTYYASLGVAALIDLVLYMTWPEMVVCYVCHARHRGFHGEPRHPRFDREIDERLRYGEKAVMGKPMRPGGTAGAPEPEH